MRKSVVLLIMLVGCGGGGSGGNGGTAGSSDVPIYAGVWRGDAIITSDPCNIANPANLGPAMEFVHTVNQDERKVVLDILGGATLSGTLNAGNDGFVVAIPPIESSPTCLSQLAIKYGTIDKGDEAEVEFDLSVTCGSLACTVVYTGVSTRDH